MNTFSTSKTLLAVTQSRLRQDPQRLAARRRIIRMRRQDGLENRQASPTCKACSPEVWRATMADARKGTKGTEVSRSEGGPQLARSGNPLFDLRNEIDTLFDRFFSTSLFSPFGSRMMEAQPLRQFGGSLPKVDVSETDREIQIVAELPGLKQDDISLNLQDDVLTVSGEARESREEKEKQYHLTERSYGRFERSFRLPDTVDLNQISANFENGLLTITLPKTENTENVKRIEIGRK
jgi:HSP20 family protein